MASFEISRHQFSFDYTHKALRAEPKTVTELVTERYPSISIIYILSMLVMIKSLIYY